MPAFDVESLLSPLPGDAPCGADLEYDPAYLALQEAGRAKAEQQYGDTVIAAQEPDWAAVHEQAMQMAQRTRDVRLAVWLTRSGARVDGLAGAVGGLQLVHGLLDRHWDHVHPQLDASDNNDPTARLNALAPLVHASEGLADIRCAGLTGARGGLTVRDVELALGRAEPLPGESVPSEDGVLQGVAAALAQAPELGARLQAGLAAVKGIAAMLEQRAATQGPDFVPLVKLMQRLADAGGRAQGGSADEAEASVGPGSAAASVAVGSIRSREDAIRTLERVCDWIERNEPSNPAPLLIRRAKRLMTKSFLDIIRDLAPDGVGQVEKIAGPVDR